MENVKDVYAEKLVVLAKSVTADEKREALEDLGISRPTLDKYLKGEGEKIEMALRLIEYFTAKVTVRFNELMETNI